MGNKSGWIADVEGIADTTQNETCDGDEALLSILKLFKRNRKHQEILYKTLLYCCEPHRFDEIETYVASLPEMTYGQVLQLPRTLIGFLVDAAALKVQEVVNDGRSEQVLVVTEDGSRAIRAFDPLVRLEILVSSKPARAKVFLLILKFCAKPQTFSQIEQFYVDEIRPFCDAPDLCVLEADYFVSQLERAGGLTWEKAWLSTERGREFVQHMQQEN